MHCTSQCGFACTNMFFLALQPKPSKGPMRIHKIENLNKALDFLKTKVSTISSACM